jgi:serine/threonine-protein kinase
MQEGRYSEAIPVLQQAVERCGESRESTCAYALYNLGRSLRLAGRPAEAIPILERRLTYDDQTETVQAELDAARRDAGAASSSSGDGGEAQESDDGDSEGRGNGNGNGRGKGKKDED